MTEAWVTILGQIPFVAVFVWFALETGKQSQQSQTRFLDALDKRDEAFETRTQALVNTMNTNSKAILDTLARMEQADKEHDDMVREKLAIRAARSRTKAAQ